MKIVMRNWPWLAVVLVFGALAVFVIAQQTVPTAAASKLDEAIALLNEGKPFEAQALIATIATNDPAYPVAQCYKALALYALGDKKGFWKSLQPEEVRQALARSDIWEEVCFKEMDAFLTYGKFDSLVGTINEFEASFPLSSRLQAVEDYRLAGLIDRGVKKSRDASRSKDESQRNLHWEVALTNLQEFLTRAAASPLTNYTALPRRVLKEDVWVARLLVGQGDEALAEIPAPDVAGREKFSLLRLELDLDLRRDEIDANLQRLADFQNEFPDPINLARVSKAAAVLNFRKGRELSLQAEAAENSGDTRTSAESRSLAAQYFGVQRSLQQNVTVDEAAGITADDILEMRDDLLYSYYLEKDYNQLSSLVTSTIAESNPGDLNWIVSKVYLGCSFANQAPPQTDAAGAVFDEVLALDFQEEHHHDRLLVAAGKWRFHLFVQAGDMDKARDLVRQVLNSQCRRDYRVAFSNQYSRILSHP